jgi:DNA-binding NarL/FixJ family response regulator
VSWPFVGRASELHLLERALSVPLPHGVLIEGARGVGKSRLLAELAGRAAHAGWDIEWLRGLSPDVPFGAIAPLVTTEAGSGGAALDILVRIREGLTDRHRGRRLLVAFDDIQQADPASALVVAQMAARGIALVVVAARSEDRLPDPVATLVKDALFTPLTVGGLGEDEVDALIAASLDGWVHPLARGRIHRLAEGNPLLLRELLADGIETGGLLKDGGVWRLAGGGLASRRVEQIVADRLDRLDPMELHALELVSVAELLGSDVLVQLCGSATVSSLVDRQLLAEWVEGRRSHVAFDHPILGEVLRSRMSAMVRRERLTQLTGALETTARRRREDAMRVAMWHLESGTYLDPTRLSNAASLAVMGRDYGLAGRLAEAAVSAGGGIEAELVRAEVLSKRGRPDDAERVYSEVQERVKGTPLWGRCVSQRAENLGIRGGNMQGAVNLVEAAIEEDPDSATSTLLRSQLSVLLAWQPRLDRAGRIAAEVIDDPQVPPPARAGAFSIASVVSYWRGLFTDVYRVDDRFNREVRPQLQPDDEVVYRMDIDRLISYMYDGRVLDAIGPIRSGYDGAIAPPIDDYAPIWAIHLAMALSICGKVQDSIKASANAVLLGERIDPTGIRGVGVALHAVYAGRAGDRAGVEFALAGIERPLRFVGPAEAWKLIARAWGHAIDGDLATAAELSTRAGREAVDCEFLVLAAWAFRQAVTFEHPELAADELEQIATSATAATFDTFARHARGLVEKDVPGVEAAAAEHAARGEYLYAVNAYQQAAVLSRRQQHAQASVRNATLAQQIAANHTQLDPSTVCADLAVLTSREVEIATLAARGLASSTIAGRLYLSVRTVDNHLASIYTKLGIHHRQDLAEFFSSV